MTEVDLGLVVGGNGSGAAVIIDSELSNSSENPVQNKVVKAAIDEVWQLIGQAETVLRSI